MLSLYTIIIVKMQMPPIRTLGRKSGSRKIQIITPINNSIQVRSRGINPPTTLKSNFKKITIPTNLQTTEDESSQSIKDRKLVNNQKVFWNYK